MHSAFLRRFSGLPHSVLMATALVALTATASTPAFDASQEAGRKALRTFAACVQAMTEDRCVASSPASAQSLSSTPAAVVFVAGVGAVRGDVYRELVQANKKMCDLVRTACQGDPDGELCATAGKLWSI